MSAGRIEETIHFSAEKDALLTYALRHEASANAVTLKYSPHEIDVILPTAEAQAWSDSDQVGIYAKLNLGEHGELELVVEKDFACLDQSDAENEDTFSNPNIGMKC
jgi:hypothetical protein